jgi:hypothetical protein
VNIPRIGPEGLPSFRAKKKKGKRRKLHNFHNFRFAEDAPPPQRPVAEAGNCRLLPIKRNLEQPSAPTDDFLARSPVGLARRNARRPMVLPAEFLRIKTRRAGEMADIFGASRE